MVLNCGQQHPLPVAVSNPQQTRFVRFDYFGYDYSGPVYTDKPFASRYTLNHFRRRSSNSEFCGSGNIALFGSCLASSGVQLQFLSLPGSGDPAHAGLPFKAALAKQDFYNQTVVSDSVSFIQLQIILHPENKGSAIDIDPSITITGESVFRLSAGRANVSIAISPMFSTDLSLGLAKLSRQVYLRASGVDMQDSHNVPLLSPIAVAMFSTGKDVCPMGYILTLDTSVEGLGGSQSVGGLGGSYRKGDSMGTGSCLFCQSGTYSINPLGFSIANGTRPVCLTCPPASTCAGGNKVLLGPGNWTVSENGMYLLENCPPGSQLINSINNVFNHDIQVYMSMQVS